MSKMASAGICPISSSAWKNYKVCFVEDAGTMWVRELPSTTGSTELKVFRHFEKQLNSHYLQNFKGSRGFLPNDKIGENVIVQHEEVFYRAKIQSIISNQQFQRVEVFLHDYAVILAVDSSHVEVVEPKDWTSIPYQAKLIKLFAISPVSLLYSSNSSQLMMSVRETCIWDAAATKFVQALFQRKHSIDFVPVMSTSDGDLYGLLTVRMKLQDWVSVIQHFPTLLSKLLDITAKVKESTKESGEFREDIARLLVRINFAKYEREILEDYKKRKQQILVSDVDEMSSVQSSQSVQETEVSDLKPVKEPINTKSLTEEADKDTVGDSFSKESKTFVIPRRSGRGRGIFSLCQNRSSMSSPVGGFEPETKSSETDSSSCFESWKQKFLVSHSPASTPDESLLAEDGAVKSCLETGTSELRIRETLCNKILSSGKTTRQINDLSDIPDILRESEIPVRANSAASLRSSCIHLPSESEQTEEDAYKLPRSKNLIPRASIEITSQPKENIAISPFESMTSSGMSASLKGLVVSPALHLGNVKHSTTGITNMEDLQCSSSQNGSEDEAKDGLQFFRDPMKINHVEDSGICSADTNLTDRKVGKESVQLASLMNTPKYNAGSTGGSQSTATFAKKSSKSKVPNWICQQLLYQLQKEKESSPDSHKSDKDNLKCSLENDDMDSSVEEPRIISGTKLLDVDSNSALFMEKDWEKKNPLGISNTLVKSAEHSVKPDEELEKTLGMNTDGGIASAGDNVHNEVKKRKKLDASFMSDARDVWTDEKAYNLIEGEFSSLLSQTSTGMGLDIASLFRVYVAGEKILDEKVVVNEQSLNITLNNQVAQNLKHLGMKATRIQAYAWPSIVSGSYTVIVGNRYSGKTFGYLVPLVSSILDSWQGLSKRLDPGIGAVLIIVCNDWRRAKYTADALVSLLPEVQPVFKVMTAWGGCGLEEIESTKVQLLEGCDVLITTPPCLVRLLTGNSVLLEKKSTPVLKETPSTSLSRCCYFVVDDADLILGHFANEMKHLLQWWGERSPNFLRQLVVTSSSWTPVLDSWIKKLSALSLRIIISSPEEAAICNHVATKVHHVLERRDVMRKVVHLIEEQFREKRNLVFVKQDEDCSLLRSMLSNSSVYCVCADNTLDMWGLQSLVRHWHELNAVTMIVSEDSVYQLLHHDLANADAIFHPYIPRKVSMSKFLLRYAFMVSNFSADLPNTSSACESHIVLTEGLLKSNIPLMLKLQRLCKEMPRPILDLVPRVLKESRKLKALCYYIKAYGRCPEKDHCKFRHYIKTSDIPQDLPRFGEVSFVVVKVINASRFLVRLTEYREGSHSSKVSLEYQYERFFCSLQLHYGDESNHKCMDYAEVGMLCVVRNKEKWARAKVDSIDYSKDKTYLTVFLIDEGCEITVALKLALEIHPNFSRLPGFIVECYLCCVKPFDDDMEWSLHASQFVSNVFRNHDGNAKFSGRIALALNVTLWLSPVIEVIHVGKVSFQKGSLRSRLITSAYGEDNKEHMKLLEDLFTEAGISLAKEDMDNTKWLDWLHKSDDVLDYCSNTAMQKTSEAITAESAHSSQQSEVDRGSDLFLKSEDIERVTEENKREIVINGEKDSVSNVEFTEDEIPINEDEKLHVAPGIAENEVKVLFSTEELPFHCQLEIKVAHVESDKRFYIQRADKIDELQELEDAIDRLTNSWEEPNPLRSMDASNQWDPDANVPPASYCLAKFTDDSYYRGWVERDEPKDCTKKVFFIDYGETVVLPNSFVQPCPEDIARKMPGQAIPCCLADLTVPEIFREKAIEAIDHLANNFDVWMLKAIGVEGSDDSKCYVVELEFGKPPKQMWRELVRQGIALHNEAEDSSSSELYPEASPDLLNDCDLDDKEVYRFLKGVPSIQAYIDDAEREALHDRMSSVDSLSSEDECSGDRSSSDVPPQKVSSLLTQHDTENQRGAVIPGVEEKCSASVHLDNDVVVPEIENSTATVHLEKNGPEVEERSADVHAGRLSSTVPAQSHQEKQTEEVIHKEKETYPDASPKSLTHPTQQHDGEKEGMISMRKLAASSQAFYEMCLRVPPLQAIEGVTLKLNPNTSWSQTSSRVILKLHLIGVILYCCRIGTSRISFKTLLGDKFYVLEENFRDKIDADHSHVKVKGLSVVIDLCKVSEGDWKSPFSGTCHRKWLRAELQEEESDEEDVKNADNYSPMQWTTNDSVDDQAFHCGLPAGISDNERSGDSDSEDDLSYFVS